MRHLGIKTLLALTLGTTALSSATVAAGLREYSPENPSTPSHQPAVSDFPASLLASARHEMQFAAKHLDSVSTDPLSADPLSQSMFLTNSAGSVSATPAQTAVDPRGFRAKAQDNSPLLIPLPTAVTAGTFGLVAMALLLSSGRVRRRIFA